jgi:hypothetical protein
MVFLSGFGATNDNGGALAARQNVISRKDYDGKDILIVLFAGVVFGAALTSRKKSGSK